MRVTGIVLVGILAAAAVLAPSVRASSLVFNRPNGNLRRAARFLAATAVILLPASAPASATTPGRNGRIFFSARPPLVSSHGCGVASVRPDATGYNCVDPFGRDPAISPDGRRIVSVRGDLPPEVYGSDINGKGVKQLTRAPGEFPQSLAPSFTPDSRHVLWFKYGGAEGTSGLYLMNLDGSGQRQLTGDGGQDPVFSPNGRLLAYSTRGIVIANADGGGAHVLLPDQDVKTTSPLGRYRERNGEPSWTPDGSRLAFSREWHRTTIECFTSPACEKTESAADVYVMNPDGSGIRQLTSTPKFDELDPSWSPDGSKIAYYRRPEGADDIKGEIWVMNADGTGQRRVALGANPEWSSLQGGPRKPVLVVRTQRINRRRKCLGRLDGVVARVRTTALRYTGFNIHLIVDGKRIDELFNARSDGVGIDSFFPRRRVHRVKVTVDDPAVGDRLSRTITIRRC